jgi:hypothetical protein
MNHYEPRGGGIQAGVQRGVEVARAEAELFGDGPDTPTSPWRKSVWLPDWRIR